jgi:large subunit ribosomal protein L21
MKYVVVRIGGRQYKVSEGEEILVDRLFNPKKIDADILLAVDGDKVFVGKPKFEGAKVSFKIVNQEEKGDKIDVYKFKAKSRYRKHMGFTPKFTRLLVQSITF